MVIVLQFLFGFILQSVKSKCHRRCRISHVSFSNIRFNSGWNYGFNETIFFSVEKSHFFLIYNVKAGGKR